jgi:ribonucleoside-diphosphate reductase alpha chain
LFFSCEIQLKLDSVNSEKLQLLNQLEIVKQNGVRQQYVDQAISLNLTFDPNDTPKWISQVHKEAHKQGVKTLYYLRTESVLRGDNLQRLSDCISCEG